MNPQAVMEAVGNVLENWLAERTEGASQKATDDAIRLALDVLAGRAKVERLPAVRAASPGRSEAEAGGRKLPGSSLFDMAESLLDGIDSLGGKTSCRGGKHAFRCQNCNETVRAKAEVEG
jgi:hypothetical protein